MSDYISREAAIEKIRVAAGCAECDGNSSVLCACDFCDVYNAIRLIKSLPAANVGPVRNGRWGAVDCDKCSVCGGLELGRTNYCPHCGAKMDLEGENHDDN